jgi:hypothetical protein
MFLKGCGFLFSIKDKLGVLIRRGKYSFVRSGGEAPFSTWTSWRAFGGRLDIIYTVSDI